MTTATEKATHTLTGFCICGHGRADHKSDELDLTGRLGGCLCCACEVFSRSDIETRERIRAAAPEMLEALIAIVNWCDHPGHGGQYDIPKPLLPYLLQARNAIREARGEA